jgi:hypothetical protein
VSDHLRTSGRAEEAAILSDSRLDGLVGLVAVTEEKEVVVVHGCHTVDLALVDHVDPRGEATFSVRTVAES